MTITINCIDVWVGSLKKPKSIMMHIMYISICYVYFKLSPCKYHRVKCSTRIIKLQSNKDDPGDTEVNGRVGVLDS